MNTDSRITFCPTVQAEGGSRCGGTATISGDEWKCSKCGSHWPADSNNKDAQAAPPTAMVSGDVPEADKDALADIVSAAKRHLGSRMQPTNLPARLRAQADRRDAMLAKATPGPWEYDAAEIKAGRFVVQAFDPRDGFQRGEDGAIVVALRNSAECETATWRAMAEVMERYKHCRHYDLEAAVLALVERLEAAPQ